MSQININNKVFTITEVEEIVKQAKILVDIPTEYRSDTEVLIAQKKKVRELIGDMKIEEPPPMVNPIIWNFSFQLTMYPKSEEMGGLMKDAMRSVAVNNRISQGMQNLVQAAIGEYLYGPVISLPPAFIKHDVSMEEE